MEVINLKGFNLNRVVKVNGKTLENNTNTQFDWGYDSKGNRHLINTLIEVLQNPELSKNRQELSDILVALIPANNFDINIRFNTYLEWIKTSPTKKRVVYNLVQVNIGSGYSIPKFLDLPNLNIKNAEFKRGSIEYNILSSETKLFTLKSLYTYYKENTMSPSKEGMSIKVYAKINYNESTDSFLYENGIGSIENYTGFCSSEYEYVE